MSRIDQALRAWESAKGAPKPEPIPAELGNASPLAHYPNEAAVTLESPIPLSTFDGPRVEQTRVEQARVEQARVQQTRVEQTSPARRVRLDNTAVQARLVTGASNSVSLEQYRRLAAVLHEEQVHSKLKTVMITSALPGEGKTLTIVNLALTLSGSYGRRVLVIDADLRAPSIHALLDIKNNRGLTEALRDPHAVLPVVEVSPGLSVLTAGRPGSTPLADLTSERMGELIRACAASFDWVLIDTPPVGLLPDAQVLARRAGAVIFVIAAGSTPASAVERAVSELGTESIIGTVLNRVDDRHIPEASYYSAYYGEDDEE